MARRPGRSRRRTHDFFDAAGKDVGHHGAGPSWSLADGSAVTGKKVAQAAAPAADAIPWLLVAVTSSSGTGALSSATYVQRVNTVAGKAPPSGCLGATLASEVPVDYAAEYYFYSGGLTDAAPDAGAH